MSGTLAGMTGTPTDPEQGDTVEETEDPQQSELEKTLEAKLHNDSPGSPDEEEETTWHQGPNSTRHTGRQFTEEKPVDRRWLDPLHTFAETAVRYVVNCRNGPNPYKPVWTTNVVRLEGEDARDFADRMGRTIWKRCLEWTMKRGPRLDWQLQIFGREAKGKKKLVNLCEQAVGIDFGPDTSELNNPDANNPHVLAELLSHSAAIIREMRIDREEFRTERKSLVEANTTIMTGCTQTMNAAIQLIGQGVTLIEAGAEYNAELFGQTVKREEARLRAEFDTAKIHAIVEGIKSAADIVSGEAGAAFLTWLSRDNPEDAQKKCEDLPEAARRLYKSMSMELMEAIGEDDFANLCSVLKHAGDTADDATAFPILVQALSIVQPKEKLIKKASTAEQKIYIQFMKGRIAAMIQAGKSNG